MLMTITRTSVVRLAAALKVGSTPWAATTLALRAGSLPLTSQPAEPVSTTATGCAGFTVVPALVNLILIRRETVSRPARAVQRSEYTPGRWTWDGIRSFTIEWPALAEKRQV